MSTTITREHMKTVADWLDAGGGPLGTERMEYRQSEIDCGYACCAVGALSIVSGRGHADAEVFALIAGVELPALGRCAAVAAQLCRRVELNVGPIIAALFRDDWDSARRAAVATQQPGGSGVWLDGIQHGQSGGDAWLYDSAQSHNQSGGKAVLYDSAQSHGMSGGKAVLYDSAQSHGQSGGVACLFGSAQSRGMSGGTLYVCSPDAKVIDRKGGLVIWEEWRDNEWVETRQEGDAP